MVWFLMSFTSKTLTPYCYGRIQEAMGCWAIPPPFPRKTKEVQIRLPQNEESKLLQCPQKKVAPSRACCGRSDS